MDTTLIYLSIFSNRRYDRGYDLMEHPLRSSILPRYDRREHRAQYRIYSLHYRWRGNVGKHISTPRGGHITRKSTRVVYIVADSTWIESFEAIHTDIIVLIARTLDRRE